MDSIDHDPQTPRDAREENSPAEISEIAQSDLENPESSPSHADSLGQDEASRLKDLATEVRDQDDLERDINRQVSYRHRIQLFDHL